MSEPFELAPGSPARLGAHVVGDGVNFALFSAHAQAVELCLFGAGEAHEHTRIRLGECTDDVWHGHVRGVGAGTQYGYRVYGPYAPHAGHRFNANKLCIDPYARHLTGAVRFASASYGFTDNAPFNRDAFNCEDSASLTPRAIVTPPDAACGGGVEREPAWPATGDAVGSPSRQVRCEPPANEWRRTWAQTVIYEAHVGGMTRLHAGVAPALRGSFTGLAQPQIIEHLHRLGVTAVELLPVHAFADDAFLVDRGLRNYWGYSTLGFFAPEHRYLAGQGPQAFRAMVDTFHAAGLEVILDVVYNHTAEGSAHGPTLSFRGIDNASYYRLDPGDPAHYVDYTGCGNTLNMGHPRVRALALDSLRYWAQSMGVDGFRFDLATTIAREADGFVAHGELFKAIEADPLLSTMKLIAEPWDIGPDGYRLGGFPPGWAEWNDRYRDTVRCFWRGDPDMLADFAQRIHGSSDLFDYPGRGPWSSVNFVASHDGFTAMDLVSYVERHNEANRESNNDGHDANFSSNYGVEGASDDPRVRAQRERHVRNLLASVLVSHGTPMLLAGDEFARSQGGNNNAYCQDNPISWLDWSLAETHADLHELTRRFAALRARHPVLCPEAFAHGTQCGCRSGFPDITWLHARGTPMSEEDWRDPKVACFGVLLCAPGSAPEVAPEVAPTTAHDRDDDLLLLVFNRAPDAVNFVLPTSDGFTEHYSGWRIALSTAGDADPVDTAPAAGGTTMRVAASCVCALEPCGNAPSR